MTARAARTATPAPGAPLSDADALTGIAAILTDPAWAVGMLEDIAALCEAAGRTVSLTAAARRTNPRWPRH